MDLGVEVEGQGWSGWRAELSPERLGCIYKVYLQSLLRPTLDEVATRWRSCYKRSAMWAAF